MASQSTIGKSPTTPTSNTNRHSDNMTIWSHITSGLLENWINEKNSQQKLLIIDSRSVNDFNTFHIRNSINIPYSKIIRRRLLNDKISIIELLMRNSTYDLINNHEFNIVVYDNQSEHTNQLTNQSFALILLHKLAQKFNSVSFLIGGFVNFKSRCEHLCEKASIIHNVPASPSTVAVATPLNNYSLPSDMDTSNAGTGIVSTQIKLFSSISRDSTASSEASNEFYSPTTAIPRPKQHAMLTHSISTYDTIGGMRGSAISVHSCASPMATSPFLSDKNNEQNGSSDASTAIRQPTKILNFLYLGSQEDALSESTMNALNITNVLNVSVNCPKPDFIADAHFLRIPVNDGHAAKLSPFFDVAYRFIEKCRKSNSNVIIHCIAGISRSPTLAIAYLMKFLNLKSDEAYKFVKERRPSISPNFNFLGQLYEFEKQQQQNNNNESNSVCKETSTTNEESLTGLSFLKFNKRLQANQNTDIKFDANASKEQCAQRKKQFFFQFNNSKTNSTSTTPSGTYNPNMLCLASSSQSGSSGYLLPSPSQAFSSFNLNSPTSSTTKNLTISLNVETPQSPALTNFQQAKEQFKQNNTNCVTKSLTLNSLNQLDTDNSSQTLETQTSAPTNRANMFMRRPTNLLIFPNSALLKPKKDFSNNETSSSTNFINNISDSMTATVTPIVNYLKRPSSILFETNSGQNTSSIEKSNEKLNLSFLSANNVNKEEKPDSRSEEKQDNKSEATATITKPSLYLRPFSLRPLDAQANKQHHLNDECFISSKNECLSSVENKSEERMEFCNNSTKVTTSNTPPGLFVSQFFNRTVSNTSANSAGSSVSSSSSTSSFTSTCSCCSSQFIVTNSVSPAPPSICSSCSSSSNTSHLVQQQQHQYQKKMKLSPVQNKSSTNSTNFFSKPFRFDVNETSSLETRAETETVVSQDSLSGGAEGDGTKAKMSFNFIFSNPIAARETGTPTSSISIINSFSSKLNESRSFETIKTLLEQHMNPKLETSVCKLKNKDSFENEDSNDGEDDNDTTDKSKKDEENASINKSSSNLPLTNSTLSTINMLSSSASSSNLNSSVKTSASAPSSRNGSTKNSLHGSIETMIEVS